MGEGKIVGGGCTPRVVKDKVRNGTKRKGIEASPLERNGAPTVSVGSEGVFTPIAIERVRKRLKAKGLRASIAQKSPEQAEKKEDRGRIVESPKEQKSQTRRGGECGENSQHMIAWIY
jgi:hypothetical protein